MGTWAGLSFEGTGAYLENNLKWNTAIFMPALNIALNGSLIQDSLEHNMTHKGLNDHAKR
jgi:hypothetical protein